MVFLINDTPCLFPDLPSCTVRVRPWVVRAVSGVERQPRAGILPRPLPTRFLNEMRLKRGGTCFERYRYNSYLVRVGGL